MEEQAFFQKVADAAAQVVHCSKCREQKEKRNKDGIDLGSIQPGWVGPEYQHGKGLVFVLQNPGVGGIKRQGNEVSYQKTLYSLSNNPAADEYLRFVETVLRMVPDWPMWQRPVSNVVEGRLSPRQIAWLNVVRFRTPCDAALKAEEKQHGRDNHLKHEL